VGVVLLFPGGFGTGGNGGTGGQGGQGGSGSAEPVRRRLRQRWSKFA
jgi:hypothetical protein